MFKFIYEDKETGRVIEHSRDTEYWPDVVEEFNYFLSGCAFIPHDAKEEYPFCEPKDQGISFPNFLNTKQSDEC